MSEQGGFESFSPSEDGGQASEAAREAAAARFAGTQQALAQIKKDEKKAKKRDDGVAQIIIHFLSDEQRTHLATLISRLVAINCPSIFILAILSLINDQCLAVVRDYLKDLDVEAPQAKDLLPTLPDTSNLSAEANHTFIEWIARMERVLATDPSNILRALLVENKSIDGTVLQLSTFALQEFFEKQKIIIPFEKLQPVAIGILQSVFQPHVAGHLERRLAEKPDVKEDD